MNSVNSHDESSAGENAVTRLSVKQQASSCFRINEPSVIYQTFDREVVAVHLNTGSYHTLPGIAGEAFLLLGSTGASTQELAVELAARYDAPVEVIEQDLALFADQLLQQSMIVAIDEAPVRTTAAFATEKDAVRAPYTAPRLESFSDLEGLVLIDPVHDVAAAGWPNVAPEPLDEGAASTTDEYVLPLMRCRIAGPNVIFERFGAETVAMDLGTGAYHSLSGTAEEIFLLLPQEPMTWEIRNALAKRYSVGEAELEMAVRDYLNRLAQEGLITLTKLEEAEATTVELRELAMSEESAGKPFDLPILETFAQPSFDGSFGEEVTFSHEHTGQASDHEGAAEREPYARRRYAVRRGDILYSTSGGETVISDRDEGKYFKLNEAASDVFRLLLQKPDVMEVVAALKRKYAVREHDLRVSVMILLWNLRKVGLVSLEKGSAAESTAEPLHSGAEPTRAGTAEFNGFDVAMYHDLKDLLRSFNVGYATTAKPKLSHARQFAMLLEDYFEEAAATAGTSKETYTVGGLPLKIQCVEGGHTAELCRAFEHLRSAESQDKGGLTISAWSHEAASPGPLLSGVLARLFENWSAVCGPRGEFLDFHCEEISAIFHPGPDILSVLDRENGKAFYLLRDDAPLPFWEQSSPFRHILHPWFDRCGLQYTHAGAVGGSNGGVLLAGKGGSGKSTTSILCASAGMLYAADDYCLTRPGDGHVFSLYDTAKLKGPEDLERLPEMSGRSFNVDSFEHGGIGKGAFSLSDLWPERMAPGFPLRAILLPAVTDRVDSRLEPCSPGEALLALAPSTVAQLPLSGQADSVRLAELAEKVPAYRLSLGSDLAQVSKLIGELVG